MRCWTGIVICAVLTAGNHASCAGTVVTPQASSVAVHTAASLGVLVEADADSSWQGPVTDTLYAEAHSSCAADSLYFGTVATLEAQWSESSSGVVVVRSQLSCRHDAGGPGGAASIGPALWVYEFEISEPSTLVVDYSGGWSLRDMETDLLIDEGSATFEMDLDGQRILLVGSGVESRSLAAGVHLLELGWIEEQPTLTGSGSLLATYLGYQEWSVVTQSPVQRMSWGQLKRSFDPEHR